MQQPPELKEAKKTLLAHLPEGYHVVAAWGRGNDPYGTPERWWLYVVTNENPDFVPSKWRGYPIKIIPIPTLCQR